MDDSGVLDGETNQQPVPLSIEKPPSSVDKVEKWGVELETKQHSPSLPYSKNWSSNGSSAHIWKYNIKDRKAERISEAVDFVKQDKQFILVGERPFTVIQLLSSYTISTWDSELAGAVKLDD